MKIFSVVKIILIPINMKIKKGQCDGSNSKRYFIPIKNTHTKMVVWEASGTLILKM